MNPPVANDPLVPVAEEFLIRFRDGDRPSVSDYAQRFPDLAARITQEFPLLAARELLRSRSVRDRAGYAANDEDAESAFQAGDELDATARQASAFGNELSDSGGDGDQEREKQRVGPYRIVRELGRGGMGIVYEAIKVATGERVALKVLPFQWNQERLDRFRREAKAAQSLRHPRIVPVLDIGCDERGTQYYAMKFIAGRPLDQIFRCLKTFRELGVERRKLLKPNPGSHRDPREVSTLSLRQLLGAAGSASPFARKPADAEASADSNNDSDNGVEKNGVHDIETQIRESPPFEEFRVESEDDDGADIVTVEELAEKLWTGAFPDDFEPPPGARSYSVGASLPACEGGAAAESPPVPAPVAGVERDRDLNLNGRSRRMDSFHAYFRSVARIGRQTADALAHAHENKILHRDIKLSNLLLDAQGQIWITDFGLAKDQTEADRSLTGTGDIIGTLRYMSPERFDRRSDARCDIYALGITLYELLTLRLAFEDDSQQRLIERIINEDPPLPSIFNYRIPVDLETIVVKSIAKSPGDRYLNSRRMREDLDRFLDNRPICATRLSRTRRIARWVQRNRVKAALIGVSALMLLASQAVVLWAWRLDKQAKVEEARLRGIIEARARQIVKAEEVARNNLEQARTELYLGRISQAGLHLNNNNYSGALKAIEDARPQNPSAKDERGWEWRWLNQRVHGELRSFDHEGRPCLGAAFSPDGLRLATISGNRYDPALGQGELKIWDAGRGSLVRAVKGLRFNLTSIAYSLDGTRIAALGSTPGLGSSPNPKLASPIYLFDSEGRLVAEIPGAEAGHARFANPGLAFTSDGRQVFTTGPEGALTFWDIATRTVVDRLPAQGSVIAFAASPDRRWIAAAELNPNRLVLWDMSQPPDRRAPRILNDGSEQREVFEIAFSPDGQRVVVADESSVATIWDLRESDKARRVPLIGHARPVRGVSFSPDGRFIATSSDDSSVRIWRAADGESQFALRGHNGMAIQTLFSPDGLKLASVGEEDRVKIWSATHEPGLRLIPAGGQESRYEMTFDQQGRILTSSRSAPRSVWDPNSGALLAQPTLPAAGSRPIPAQLAAFASHDDKNRFAYVTRDDPKTIALYRDDSSGPTGKQTFSFSHPVKAVALSADGQLFAASAWTLGSHGPAHHEAKCWFLGDRNEPSRTLSLPIKDGVATSMDFSERSGYLVAAVWNPKDKAAVGAIHVFNSYEWNILPAVHSSRPLSIAVSADGRRVASSDLEGNVLIQSISDFSDDSPQRIQAPEPIFAMAFHPDGVRLAGSGRKFVTLWHLPTQRDLVSLPLPELMPGDYGFHCRVAFDSAGSLLAAVNFRGNIAVWDGRELNQEVIDERGRLASSNPSWHLRQAQESRRDRDRFGLRFHLRRLRRFEEALTQPQREEFHEILGSPEATELASEENHR